MVKKESPAYHRRASKLEASNCISCSIGTSSAQVCSKMRRFLSFQMFQAVYIVIALLSSVASLVVTTQQWRSPGLASDKIMRQVRHQVPYFIRKATLQNQMLSRFLLLAAQRTARVTQRQSLGCIANSQGHTATLQNQMLNRFLLYSFGLSANQPAVLFSHTKSAPATSYQPVSSTVLS